MKQKLLLDVCCGPCSTHVIKELIKDYNVTIFFPNSNVYPEQEHTKRLKAAVKVAEESNLKLIEDTYDHNFWLNFIKGLENEPEGGKRCEKCFEFRLNRTAKHAKQNNYNCFTTTLTVSPHKDFEIINYIGKQMEKKHNIKFIKSDFKKNDGFRKSIQLSKEYDIYRQNYCGCEFSMRKEKRLIQNN
ncbi:MAG: epoxyqueuosine reductase QueH [Candidatus Woesearchaeota archaeon]